MVTNSQRIVDGALPGVDGHGESAMAFLALSRSSLLLLQLHVFSSRIIDSIERHSAKQTISSTSSTEIVLLMFSSVIWLNCLTVRRQVEWAESEIRSHPNSQDSGQGLKRAPLLLENCNIWHSLCMKSSNFITF